MELDGAEVVVVGGGATGLASAWFLARAGVDVVVVEKELVGSEASQPERWHSLLPSWRVGHWAAGVRGSPPLAHLGRRAWIPRVSSLRARSP